MNFKENVMFYLGNINNIKESEENEELESSCETEVCPECGKKKCKCKKSIETGGDGDDGAIKSSVKDDMVKKAMAIKKFRERNGKRYEFAPDHEDDEIAKEMEKVAVEKSKAKEKKTMKESISEVNRTVNGIHMDYGTITESANTKVGNEIKDFYKKLFK